MTRGRHPRKACREACRSAAQRGQVLDAAGSAGRVYDFILFSGQQVVFVRVKRCHSRIGTKEDTRVLFSSESAGLRTVPLTAVVSREIWVLLPWGTWQYFLIGDDHIREIPDNHGKGTRTDENTAEVQAQRHQVPAPSSPE